MNSLRKVEVRAMVGQSSTTSAVVPGASASRRVRAFTTHPELQVGPLAAKGAELCEDTQVYVSLHVMHAYL